MSKEYLVFVQGADYFEVEAADEQSAKTVAVETFKNNPGSAAYDAEIMRETEEGAESFPVPEEAANA